MYFSSDQELPQRFLPAKTGQGGRWRGLDRSMDTLAPLLRHVDPRDGLISQVYIIDSVFESYFVNISSEVVNKLVNLLSGCA